MSEENIKLEQMEEELVGKGVDLVFDSRTCYPTGFRNIDTNIGFRVYDDDTGELLKTNRGFLSGSWITYIGVSASGKTTLALQMISAAMRPFILKGDTRVKLHLVDIEQGLHHNRLKKLAGWTDENIADHVVFEEDVTIEGFTKLINKLIEEKRDKKYKPDMTENTSGKNIPIPHPTFILVDSISEMVGTKSMDDVDHDNTMYMKQRLLLDSFIKKFKTLMVKYNINVMAISHLSDNVDIGGNPMARPVRQMKALESNKKISAGKAVTYATDIGIYINRIEAVDKQAVDKKGGSILDASSIKEMKLFKNRQGLDNIKMYLVTDTQGTFSPLDSFIYECQDLKVITSAGATKMITGTEFKCRSQDLKKKILEEADFRQALFDKYDENKQSGLDSVKNSKEERERMNSILDIMTL